MAAAIKLAIAYVHDGSPLPSVDGARFITRRPDLWRGEVERQVGATRIVAVFAPGRPEIAAAYDAAGIKAIDPDVAAEDSARKAAAEAEAKRQAEESQHETAKKKNTKG